MRFKNVGTKGVLANLVEIYKFLDLQKGKFTIKLGGV